jgi:hypothetical protein
MGIDYNWLIYRNGSNYYTMKKISGMLKMGHRITFLVMVFAGLVISVLPGIGVTGAVTPPVGNLWEECPDGVSKINQFGDIISTEFLYDMCYKGDDKVSHIQSKYSLAADWWNAPIEGNDVDISSIELVVKMKGCAACNICNGKYAHADIWVWNNDIPGKWKKVETANIYNDIDYVFDITSSITPNGSGAYKVKIENSDNQGTCIWVDYVGLKIVYLVLGETRIWMSPINIEPSANMPKYSSFIADDEITCTGGDCEYVKVYLRYLGIDQQYHDISASPAGNPIYTASNPYQCGKIDNFGKCYPEWVVYGWEAGTYHIKAVTYSGQDYMNETGPEQVIVNGGELGILRSYISSGNIDLGGSAQLYGNVECGIAPCGNVNMLAKYRNYGSSDDFISIGPSGSLITTNTNPYLCEDVPKDGLCSDSWNIIGNEHGIYEIKITASSDDPDISDQTKTLHLTVNPEEIAGMIDVTGVGVSPGFVNVSETATLYGTVGCDKEYCGNINAYARSGGVIIGSNGLSIVGNPKLCSGMNNGDSCSVSWNVVGDIQGTYNLDIRAESDQSDVQSITSSAVSLTVRDPVGSISFPFDPTFGPGSIDMSETAELAAVVECDSDYCGKATATLKYNEIFMGDVGGLTTQNQNPQECENYPCDLSWGITGVNSGSYSISLSVASNESDDILFGSYGLTVMDPDKPSLLAIMGSLGSEYQLGDTFTLKGQVTCSNGDCGEVKAYAKYKVSEQDTWTDLTGSTPLSATSNPKTAILVSDETQLIEWAINSSSVGNYILGISVDATNPGVIDSGITSKSVEIFKGSNVEIYTMSPETGKTLARGDEFLLKISATESGYPMIGATVTASSEGFFMSENLDEIGNGIYSKTLSVGNGINRASYVITFYVQRDSQTFTKTTNVYVNPEMEVSLETDKNGYEILDKIKLQGQVLKNGKPVQASIDLKFVCPSRSFKEITLDTDSSGNYYHEYLISMATPNEICSFELNTIDNGGNYNFTSRKVSISASENEVYKIDFISPSPGNKYKKGESVGIRVKVLSGSDPLEGADVKCLNPLFEENIILNDAGNGIYEGDYLISNNAPDDLWVLTCVAKTMEGFFGSKSVNIYVMKLELNLERISPSQTNFQPGDTADFLIKIQYPDGTSFSNATVYLKSGGQIVYLSETNEPGVYEGSYGISGQGIVSFDVYAEDQFGNTGSFPGEIVLTAGFSPISLYWLVLPFVIAVMLLTGVVWKRGRGQIIKKEIIIKEPSKPMKIDKKTDLKEKIADLERKIGNIEKSKYEVEQEYYQRKVDEKTFNKMVQNYEQERIRLNVEVKSLKKELARL